MLIENKLSSTYSTKNPYDVTRDKQTKNHEQKKLLFVTVTRV